MNLPDGITQVVIIACYLVGLLVLGFVANRLLRGTQKDYLLANHSIGPFLLLMSLFGTSMTAFALVGSSGQAFKEGIGVYALMASSSGIVHSLCFFLIGIKLWRLGRAYGYSTQIEYFRDRFNSNWFGLLLFPVIVGLVIPYLLIGILGSGSVIQGLTAGAFPDLFPSDVQAKSGGIPPWLGSGVICLVVLIYVFFGGMRGTAWANAIQTMIFMVLGVITFVLLTMKLGKEGTLHESMIALSESTNYELLARGNMSQTNYLSYMLIPLSVAMFPHIFQHWLTARSAESFKLSVVCHPIFIMIVWAPCVLIGVWANSTLAPEPPSDPNAVLAYLVKTQVGPMLGGFLAAGILAAIMSSLDSQFLCLGSIFTNDIVIHYAGKDRFSEKQQMLIARGFIIGVVLLTYIISLLIEGNKSIFSIAVWCFSGYAALFPLVFGALYWRRLNIYGATASLIAAAATWIYYFIDWGFRKAEYVIVVPIGETKYDFNAVTTMFAASAIAMIVVTYITPKPDEKLIARFFTKKLKAAR
jgi:solute:Na+ symporter, SSS family